MYLSFLLVKDFRNYEYLEIPFYQGVSLLFGDNALGKTNVLEACYYLSTMSSHRAEKIQDLARWGTGVFTVGGRVGEEPGKLLRVTSEVVPYLKHTITIDGVKKKKQDIAALFPCVFFSPDDLSLVKGSSSKRRAMVDSVLSRTDPVYAREISRYTKVLTRRNAVLKKGYPGPGWQKTMDSLNQILVESGALVLKKRLSLMNELDQNVSRTYGYLVGGQCKLAYKSSIGEIEKEEKTIRERFFSVLTKLAKAEAERKMTLVGPHRDDVNILLAEDKSYRYFGSQGQQRSIALALRLAEAETINQVLDKKPLLLLDDIFSSWTKPQEKSAFSL